jgi:thymidylate kinase
MPTLTVELFGLPGAGKSTTTQQLLRALRDDDVTTTLACRDFGPEVHPAVRITRKVGAAARAIRAAPGGSGAMARALADSHQRRAQDVPRRLLNWLAVQGVLRATPEHPDVRILDEGVAQALWSIALWGDADGVLAVLARDADSWRRPDLLVVLDTPVELAHARLRERATSHSRVDRIADPGAQLEELQRGRALVRRIVTWWVDLTAQTVIDVPVDAQVTPELVGRRVADAVGARMPSR